MTKPKRVYLRVGSRRGTSWEAFQKERAHTSEGSMSISSSGGLAETRAPRAYRTLENSLKKGNF